MKRIVCYGESLIDFTYDGQAFVPHPGGSPYNVAVALGRLGVKVDYCTQLSTDMFGDMLISHLHNSNVGTEYIHRHSAPSTLAFVVTHPEAEPEYAFYSNHAADVILRPEDLPTHIEAELHHFGSISLTQEPCGTTWEDYLSRCDGFISFDPNIRPSLIPDRARYLRRFNHIIAHTQLLRMSLSDLAWLFPEESTAAFVDRMLYQGVAMVAITGGSQGAWAYTSSMRCHQPVMPVSVEDTIGAGDTFTAGLLSVLLDMVAGKTFNNLSEIDLNQALKTASIAAALNCQHKGTKPPLKEEVKKLL